MTTSFYTTADGRKLPAYLGEKFQEVGDHYLISTMGRLFTTNYKRTGRIHQMKPAKRQGYMSTVITLNGKSKSVVVHRLVAQAFIPNPQNKPQVNHINHIRFDNRVENLEWCTHRENIDHMMAHGRQTVNHGTKNGMAKLTEDQVKEIREKHEPFVYTRKMLAEEYGVSEACIKDVLYRYWKHVK